MFNQFKKNLSAYMKTQVPGAYRYELGSMLEQMVNSPQAPQNPTYDLLQVEHALRPSHATKKLFFELWAYGYHFHERVPRSGSASGSEDEVEVGVGVALGAEAAAESHPQARHKDELLGKDLSELVDLLYGTTYWA